MKDKVEQTPAELAEEEHQAAIARGDILEDETSTDESEGASADEFEDDEPGDGPDEDIQIPKARFDEARKAAKLENDALKARIAALEKGTKSDVVTIEQMEADLDALEDKYEGLLLQGELDQAKLVRKDITKSRNAIIDRRIDAKSTAMGSAAVEQVRYDAQLANFEAKYPAMNPDAVEFDEEISNEIGVLMEAFEAKGMTITKALNKAVHYVLGKATPEVKSDTTADDVRKARKLEAQKKALETVQKTPADLKDVGRNSDKAGRDDGLPDPLKMSQAQFDKLTEEQKAAMRGDKLGVH